MQRSTAPGSMHSVSKTYSCVAIMFAALGLAACGGGGGGSDSPPTPPPAPPPSAPANTAPTVQAGADQTIQLPANAVDLQGSATDAEGGTLTYAWTAAPAAGVTFANAAAAATNVTFTDAGTYTLTLTVSDGTASGSDTVQITVSAAAPPPPPPPPPPVTQVWPGADPNDPVADPNHGWIAAEPADVGMDATQLDAAQQYALTGGGAGMVTRHGRLVRKWSDPGTADPADDITIDTRIAVKSTTKAIGGMALALALDGGLLTLDDLATTHLPSIGNPPATNPQDQLNQIRIFHLATHTAGFEKEAAPPADLLYGPPGTTFFYSDAGLNWLADVLTTKHNQDLLTLLRTRVFGPLGIAASDLMWTQRSNVNGLEFRRLASDISTNANAMARIGLLYLRNGTWNGTQILSESSVRLAGTPVPQIAQIPVYDPTAYPNATSKYGLLWWTNANGELAGVPTDAYWAWGLGDSLIVVIPSLDIVVSRVGRNPDGPGPHWRVGWNGNYEVLRQFLVPIVQSVTNPAL